MTTNRMIALAAAAALCAGSALAADGAAEKAGVDATVAFEFLNVESIFIDDVRRARDGRPTAPLYDPLAFHRDALLTLAEYEALRAAAARRAAE